MLVEGEEEGSGVAEEASVCVNVTLHHSNALGGRYEEVLRRLSMALDGVAERVTRMELLEQLHETRATVGALFSTDKLDKA